MPSAIPIIEEEEKLYVEIHYPNKDIVDTNYALFQIAKQEFAEILESKKEIFWIKAII